MIQQPIFLGTREFFWTLESAARTQGRALTSNGGLDAMGEKSVPQSQQLPCGRVFFVR